MNARAENFWRLVNEICEQGKRRVMARGADASDQTSQRAPAGADNADDTAADELTVELIANI